MPHADQQAPSPARDGDAERRDARREVEASIEAIELELLLEGVCRRYGGDLRGYARAALKQRVLALLPREDVASISALQERVLRDRDAMARLLVALTISATDLFRDPAFYLLLRRRVIPLLRTYPFVRIWIAGCSTGEEVYATAIVLAEEGLTSRVRIYATDLSERVLAEAKAGVYPLETLASCEQRYLEAGGRRSFAEHVTVDRETMTLSPSLRDNVVFGQHNLATDRSFNEFNLVLCRNVLIHFGPELRRRVHDLLHESLGRLGVLGLGARESLRGSPHEDRYEALDAEARLYRRVG